MTTNLLPVRNALLSVANKEGLVEFARALRGFGVELMATGGTYNALEEEKVRVRSLQDDLKLPSALSGRVKTLHYPLFAAILAKHEPNQLREIQGLGVKPIDMVVCNFYPFQKVISDPSATQEEIIENIDIGGPSMVRASAKNFEYVTVVPSPTYYESVIEELRKNGGKTTIEMRRRLARMALAITASYDISIYNGLSATFLKGQFPEKFFLSSSKFQDAKYGENPDQRATIYSIDNSTSMNQWKQLAGDRLSFNNQLDIGSAYKILEGFEGVPAAATVKHGNISGFAFAPLISEAYTLAHSCDPEADFGGTVMVNRRVDREAAKLIGKNEGEDDSSVYTEILMAPSYEPQALKLLESKQKKKIRIIQTGERSDYPYNVKVLEGSVLVQEEVDYRKKLDKSKLTYPTGEKPDYETLLKLLASWEVVRRVPSNGIVIAAGRMKNKKLTHFWTLGVGSFRKRNGAVKVALENAGTRARDSVCASDGFFPFRDSIDLLGEKGVRAVIQPGGSVSDEEVTQAANEFRISMVLTHTRAFKH
ncbi:MAG: bifunctional phosphoribosylaminoimidazolecarboxamide formyltransferase/IMP cyclohydrolase [Thaumarchaeota archaeon]|nr:bifunctional phosphoribosylaminoimidazolecarboxamide formyltransferase/IMP cyclohydrolase [Nitrososphaerota archaeon]